MDPLQSFFDQACALQLAQGCIAADADGCFLRLPEGDRMLKCVIGQMITDEQIVRYGIPYSASVSQFPEELIGELIPNVDGQIAENFMRAMQAAHDGLLHYNANHAGSPQSFETLFKRSANLVAKQFHLKEIA